MASKFGYRLTKRAESDLDGIVSYIAVELQIHRQHLIS